MWPLIVMLTLERDKHRHDECVCLFVCLFSGWSISPPSSQRVLSHQDDTALLKAYIVEWRKFFTQCDILPKPFCQLEITLMGKQGSNKKTNMEDSIVRKVRGQHMSWGTRSTKGSRRETRWLVWTADCEEKLKKQEGIRWKKTKPFMNFIKS